MRIALMSDIHGNLPALEAVLAALRQHGPFDAKVCAGDMVFLGPSPVEVLDLMQAEGIDMVRGNSDDMVSGVRPPEEPEDQHHAQLIKDAVAWNQERVPEKYLQLLRDLPLTRSYGSLVVCHSSPESNDDTYPWIHLHTEEELRRVYGATGAQAVCHGHWHGAGISGLAGLMLVNVSSVSIPPDGQALAGYTIGEYHQGFWRFQQHRVPYNLAPHMERMKALHMPEPPWPKYER